MSHQVHWICTDDRVSIITEKHHFKKRFCNINANDRDRYKWPLPFPQTQLERHRLDVSHWSCPVYTEWDCEWKCLRLEKRIEPTVSTRQVPHLWFISVWNCCLPSGWCLFLNSPETNMWRQQCGCFTRGKQHSSCLGLLKPAEWESTGEVQRRLLIERRVGSHPPGFARCH